MIGTDIVNVHRIERIIDKLQEKFLKRVFSVSEISSSLRYFGKVKLYHFAKRFAAKEAYLKATSNFSINWKDIEVYNDKNGKPFFCIKGVKQNSIRLSLSDDTDYAIAFVMIC